jgi:hypothetical protein
MEISKLKTIDILPVPYTIVGDQSLDFIIQIGGSFYIMTDNVPNRFIRYLLNKWFGLNFFKRGKDGRIG